MMAPKFKLLALISLLLFVAFTPRTNSTKLGDILEATPDEVLDQFMETSTQPEELGDISFSLFEGQKVDHFDLLDKRTFSERYWQYDNYFDEKNGTVQLYFCAETACSGMPKEHMFPGVLAKAFRSRLYVLEHRFYGESQPFPDLLSVDHLRYLTVQQALADAAYFIEKKNEEIEKEFGFKPKWYCSGGSYAGAKSAWFRTLYPNLVETALASSAVVNAIADYQQYDEQIRRSLLLSSEECANNIRQISRFAQWMVEHSTKSRHMIKKMFNAEHLGDVQFLEFIAGSYSELVQYGQRTTLCEAIKADNFKDAFKKFMALMKEMGQLSGAGYGLMSLQDQKIDPTQSGRQWFWQTCSQLGYFATAHIKDPEESPLIDLDYYQQQCAAVFEQPIWLDQNVTNTMLQGANNQGTKIVFNNGVEDPYQWASLHKPNNDQQVTTVIDCQDCAHCVDLYYPKPTDAPTLKAARRLTMRMMAKWLDIDE